ncbi:tetratricopeptide repeat protein [Anaerovibrio lipolyticus]|uniref:tetratricopeptide repeat protein n=1 Tax=Anaerovibrio lipolyticus TaxID=82374 RepID=UPI0023F05ECF|nr:tetratricopeptide repeat protein [Anaerovibrio lipolyticus]
MLIIIQKIFQKITCLYIVTLRNNFPKLCNEVITDNKIADEKYGSYIEKAFEAHENKDWEKEYTYLKNAYDNGCQSQAILHDLAEACWNLGDYDNAIEWASKRIDLTNSAFAYKTRAYYYYLLEKNDLALEDAQWATMKVKDNPGIIDTRGMIYTALGQYDKALADFNAVLKINDKYASAYYHRGKCYEALGKKR